MYMGAVELGQERATAKGSSGARSGRVTNKTHNIENIRMFESVSTILNRCNKRKRQPRHDIFHKKSAVCALSQKEAKRGEKKH